jgi:hypothetical protein
MMPEGLSPTEVGKEIEEHRKEAHSDEEEEGSARVFTIVEAVMLAVVAVLAAWSGFASAKWGTESSLNLAKASAARTEANRADLTALSQKNFDSSTFDAWFTAYTLNNQTAMNIAVKRFSPEFLRAFNSWLATDPATNPNAPKGPTYMPDYVQPGLALSNRLDKQADERYALGEAAASNSDNYVRTTIFLASVLFLVGISTHFRVRGARIALVVVGGAIMTLAIVLLALAPKPVL